MRRVAVADLTPGSVLARAIFNEKGNVLLQAGVPLTDRLITLLRQRYILSVLVSDADTTDIEIAEALSERVRMRVTPNIARHYGMLQRRGQVRPESLDVEALRRDVIAIVDDILHAETIVAINTIRAHDTYSFQHALDGTVTALLLARRLGYNLVSLRRLAAGCLLRDIGMVRIDSAILSKPGPLSTAEWSMVRKHPETGYQILRGLRPDSILSNHIAFQHHERQDGLGYPRGLVGTNQIRTSGLGPGGTTPEGQILPDAEIAAIADVYDALVSDRSYRPAYAPDRAVSELRALAGNHLNAAMLAHFFTMLPVYPVGSDVLVQSGEFAGCFGVVVALNRESIDRPIVRLLRNRSGQRVEPREIDLTHMPDTAIIAIPAEALRRMASA